LGLKSALVAANGAATDATVEFTDDGGLHSAAANLAKGSYGRAKLLGILTFQRDWACGQTGHHHQPLPPPPKKI